MRIVFISANNYKVPYPVYPIGTAYLMTYINQRFPACSTCLFDCNQGDMEALGSFLRQDRYDLAVVSLRNIDDVNIFEQNSFLAHYKRVIQTIRQNSSARIEIGGPAFSIFPELLFRALQPDYGAVGEGEETLAALIRHFDRPEEIQAIEGLVWQDAEGQIVINRREHYVSAPTLQFDSGAAAYYFEQSGMLNIQTKRGCPFRCIYCTYPLIDGRKVRTLDARTVVDNIEQIYRKHHVDYFFFTDSVFNIRKDYNEELCRRLIESPVNIRWGAYFSPFGLTYADLELYQRAGLTHIEWGTDTFSDQQLELYGKNFTYSDIRRTSQDASKLGIFYAHFLILGGYGETDATLDETFERSKQLGLTVFFPFIGMRIYPRTILYDYAVRDGVIRPEDNLVNPTYYVSPHIDIATIAPRARATGQAWVFPDDDHSDIMARFRRKKIRGPLWEYLRYAARPVFIPNAV
ncbi:MAG: radical SAM protein [Bacteroidales bacterium]|nr:radical SAM protein [Bacteroidales bacterium]